MREPFWLLLLCLLLPVACRPGGGEPRLPTPAGQTDDSEVGGFTLHAIGRLRDGFAQMRGARVTVQGVVTSVGADVATLQDGSGALLLAEAGEVTLEQQLIVTGRLAKVEGNLALVEIEERLVEAERAPFPTPVPLTFAPEQESLYVESGPGRFSQDGWLELAGGRRLAVRPLDPAAAGRVAAGTRVDSVRGVLRRGATGWELLPTHSRDITVAPVRLAPCEIQGAGFSSPYRGKQVETTGVVTADLQAGPGSGFFLQLPACDDDPASTDGLFVAVEEATPLDPGDRVRLRGRVEESYGRTQIRLESGAIRIEAEDRARPAPVPLAPPDGPNGARRYFEALEGMLVRLDEAQVVGPTTRHGEFAIVPATAPLLNRRLLREGGGSGQRLLVGTLGPAGPHQLAVGDQLRDLAGPLDFSYGQYKIQPVRTPQIERAPVAKLPDPPVMEAGWWSVATYNVENLLNPANGAGTASDRPDPQVLANRLRKLATIIAGPLGMPAIVALQEVEDRVVLDRLAAMPRLDGRYRAVLLEGNDPRGIDQGLLVARERVEVLDAALANRCSPVVAPGGSDRGDCPPGERLLFARPPLVVHLRLDGERELYLVNNHFKSKRGGEGETMPRRRAQARYVAALTRRLLEQAAGVEVIVVGDLNDHPASDPLLVLAEEAPLTNLWERMPPEARFSYNYNGISQVLDHMLVTGGLAERLVRFTPLRVNADFPHGWQHDPSIPYRTSDHDPLLAVFR